MKQIQTIEWMPFNADSKPVKWFDPGDQVYLVIFEIYGRFFFREAKWTGKKWEGFSQNPIAYAELPKDYDPAAKTFNFMTALALMKEGKECRRVGSHMKITIRDNCFIRGFDGSQTWTGTEVTLAELEGEWELV